MLEKIVNPSKFALLVWQNEICQNSFFLISSNFESTVSNPKLLEMKYEENNFSFHIIPKLWQILKKSVLAKGPFIKHKPLISEECKVC